MKSTYRLTLVIGTMISMYAVLAEAVSGQGFAVYSHSACAAARGGSGVADPCSDGSAVYYNPAGLIDTPTSVAFGLNYISLDATFIPDEGPSTSQQAPPSLVPHGFAIYRPNRRLALAAGVFMPYGLAIRWPEEFRGSFSGSHGKLMSFYFQPTAALRATDWLQLGFGVNVVRTSVELEQRLDLSTVTAAVMPNGPITFGELGVPRPTGFATADLMGTTWAAGWHAGAIVRVSNWLSIGGRYLSEVRNDFDDAEARFDQRPTGIVLPAGNPLGVPAGTPLDAILSAQFEAEGALADQGVATMLAFPAQAVAGVGIKPGRAVRLYGDYVWTDWSAYREVRLRFARAEEMLLIQDYEDTGTLRLGAEVDAFDAIVARLGYTSSDPAAPDATVTPLLPDSRRRSYSVGAGARLGRRARVDAFLSYIDQDARRGRLLPRSSRSIGAEALNEGEFSGWGFEGGATVRFIL